MIFNIAVDAVVRVVLEEVFSPQEAQHGMGWAAGEINLVFCANDRRILGRDHDWVQDALSVTVAMFRHMVLETNLEKPRRWCVPLGSSGGSGKSWHISGGRRGGWTPSGIGRRQGWAALCAL